MKKELEVSVWTYPQASMVGIDIGMGLSAENPLLDSRQDSLRLWLDHKISQLYHKIDSDPGSIVRWADRRLDG